jgi:hypothetical protein
MQDNFSVRNWKNKTLYKEEYSPEINIYGYQTEHFDMCPGAKALFKGILAGEYTDGVPSAKEEASVIAMAKLHDALFNMEKKAEGYGEVDRSYLTQAERLEDEIYRQARNLDLENEVKAYIPGHIDRIANVVVNPKDLAEEDDIELEIPGDESTATIDKTVQAKASKQDKIIKDFQRLQDQMKTHLELYKTSESPANKETAKNMLKKLTPEFQAAKKAYEKLKGVKI